MDYLINIIINLYQKVNVLFNFLLLLKTLKYSLPAPIPHPSDWVKPNPP